LILDCCHSGAAIEGAKSGQIVAITEKTFGGGGQGRFVFASSSSTQQSFEDGSSSEYTRWLVDGLKEGRAAPEKDVVSVADLGTYLEGAAKSGSKPMNPLFWMNATAPDIPLFKNPRKVKPIPPDWLQALNSKEDGLRRVGAINKLRMLAATARNEKQKNEILALLNAKLIDPDEDSFSTRKEIEDAIGLISHSQLVQDGAKTQPPPEQKRMSWWVPMLSAVVAAILSYYLSNFPDPFSPPTGSSNDIWRAHNCLLTRGTSGADRDFKASKSPVPGCFGVVIATCTKKDLGSELECARRENAAWSSLHTFVNRWNKAIPFPFRDSGYSRRLQIEKQERHTECETLTDKLEELRCKSRSALKSTIGYYDSSWLAHSTDEVVDKKSEN
jgi:hypothetical protein